MKAMSLKEIASACGGHYYGDKYKLNREVTGVAIDSRKIEEGYLFIPIKGAHVDGHNFISQVIEKGALCTLSEQSLGDVPFSYILVFSCEQALKDLAEHYRKNLDIKVVGITGSVGKTSTKEMIASVLSQKYNVLKTEGNFNNEIGLPLTIFNIREEHEVAVLEMGISNFGEMSNLAKIARPNICVITNIEPCHLENLIDRDGVLKAKTEMFDFAQSNATIILNGDDDKLITMKNWNGYSPLYFGLSTEANTFAKDIRGLSLKGTLCTICIENNSFEVTIPIPGHHMVYNALAGTLVGREFGLTNEEIKKGIESLIPILGRSNIVKTKSFFIIDDCYNANPTSMKASIDMLATVNSRKVAILGDMLELGQNEKEFHYEIGRYVAEKGIDLVICIGNLSEYTAKGASYSNSEVRYFKTKAEFLTQAENFLEKGDTMLIKASHGMEFKEIVKELKNK